MKFSQKIRMIFWPNEKVAREKSFSIGIFNKGNIITRLKRTERGDGSWIGEPFRFIGIDKNQIVIQFVEGHGHSTHRLNLDDWEDGWGFYSTKIEDRETTTLLLKAGRAVLGDHKERIYYYPETEGQPRRVELMAELEKTIRIINRRG